MEKIIDLENDGLNLAVDGPFLYVRCKRAMLKYDLADMSLKTRTVVFKKDGKARGFSISENHVFLTDFCDLYILNKDDLSVAEIIHIGNDLSSDLGAVRFGSQKAYVAVRNGKMAVLDIEKHSYEIHNLCDSSFWDFCVAGNRIYAGTVQGELLEIDTDSMRVSKQKQLCKKNIYSVMAYDGLIYTVSQDKTIKITSAEGLGTICTAPKTVSGMAKILGIFNDYLVIADTNKVTLWDRRTLAFCNSCAFPTGAYNKGIILAAGRLLGSDYHSVYGAVFE